MFRKFTICLNAFITIGYVSRWITIWSGNSLSDLSKKEFYYFKKRYGLNNLSLSSYYQFKPDSFDYDDDYYFNEAFF